ncbi:hypothetical protein LTR01_008687 [Friedmanniomyces endolithicus]|nr:hypothetical protein LTR01_008687 [Friedmanniomyces endolithicus]KAK0823166.1 hypothetical protein LTR73_008738 [Friedmanniomyces endolithicus]
MLPVCILHLKDPDPYYRGKGWALYLHWCLDNLFSLLPQHLIDRLPETYVDPVATANGENGRLRRLLMEGIEVQVSEDRRLSPRHSLRFVTSVGKEITGISAASSPTSVSAQFGDGTSASGTLLVGCDGSRSGVRTLLYTLRGSSPKNHALPVRFLGACVTYPSDVGRVMQEKDPFCFQGGDPRTDSFFFFSFLDTPANNDREDRSTFDCQIIVRWPYRAGFLGRDEPTEIPAVNEARLRLMKKITDGWVSPYRDVVRDIPENTPVQQIRLEDWPPEEDSWENFEGRATLVGDAAHAMTMFEVRGEAAHHGVRDVQCWLNLLLTHIGNGSFALLEVQFLLLEE